MFVISYVLEGTKFLRMGHFEAFCNKIFEDDYLVITNKKVKSIIHVVKIQGYRKIHENSKNILPQYVYGI